MSAEEQQKWEEEVADAKDLMMKADEAVPVPIVISHIEYRSHSGPVTP